MGLDLSAYSGLSKIAGMIHDDDTGLIYDAHGDEVTGDVLVLYANHHFPGVEAPWEHCGVYSYQRAVSGPHWSYSGYNRWRDELAMLAGYPLTTLQGGSWLAGTKLYAAACWEGATGPFSELINFSDCEGTIGAKVAAKLLKDFRDWEERAEAYGQTMNDDGFWLQQYREVLRCLELAADNGAITFH